MTRRFARTLSAGCAHIVFAEHFQQRRARQPADKCGLDEGEGERRQEDVIEAIQETAAAAIDREPAEIEGEDDQQQCPEIEVGDGVADEREDAHAAVRHTIAMGGGSDAEGDADGGANQHGDGGQLDRVGQVIGDQTEHRLVGHHRLAEIERAGTEDEMDILQPERRIEAHLGAELRELIGGCHVAERARSPDHLGRMRMAMNTSVRTKRTVGIASSNRSNKYRAIVPSLLHATDGKRLPPSPIGGFKTAWHRGQPPARARCS